MIRQVKIGRQPHPGAIQALLLGAENASKRRSKPTLESVDQEYSWLSFREMHNGIWSGINGVSEQRPMTLLSSRHFGKAR